MRTIRSRHLVSGGMIGLTYVAAVLATLPLLLILWHLLQKGASREASQTAIHNLSPTLLLI